MVRAWGIPYVVQNSENSKGPNWESEFIGLSFPLSHVECLPKLLQMEVAKFQEDKVDEAVPLIRPSFIPIDRLIGSGREPMLLLDLYPITMKV